MENTNYNYEFWDDPNFDEDDYIAQNGTDDLDEDPWEDDYCCYDPRYTGPSGHCFCKENAEQEERDKKWYNRLRYWWYVRMIIVKDWLRVKGILPLEPHYIQCEKCDHVWNSTKTKSSCCPMCDNINDLPF